MKVAVVSEFYPRRADPVLGLWAHRQALAARDAGAEVEVLVLHRLVAPRAAMAGGPARLLRAQATLMRQPLREVRDGLRIHYVPYVSPARDRAYARWGAWAAPALGVALRRLRRRFAFELVHAHNAVPAGDAVRRAGLAQPLVVSVHGSDVFHTAVRAPGGQAVVDDTLGAARLVLANSSGIEALARDHGARATRVVHLGADAAAGPGPEPAVPTLITIAHLVARKRHADVVRALARLSDGAAPPRYVVVGDGPERANVVSLAQRLGLSARVILRGQLAHDRALSELAAATLFVMPSVDEAFGVAYVEAMAAGVPAIATLGEPGPSDIAAAGPGVLLVAPGDVDALARTIGELLADERRRRSLREAAWRTASECFSWERCGQRTVAAYEEALA